MPSATKQKIPADLWHHRHGRFSPGHCVPMQASPGQSDVVQDDSKKHSKLSLRKVQTVQKTQRKQKAMTIKGNNGSLPLRGSSDDLRVATVLIDNTSKPVTKVPSGQVLAVSHSAKSSSTPRGNSPKAFAMDTALPPHPSELPLPPTEWLKPSSQSPLTISRTLQTILTCQVAA